MHGTFDRMKIHFSLCAQHLQRFKNASSTEEQFAMLLDSIPEVTERWISAAGWLRACEETPCEICLTTDSLGCNLLTTRRRDDASEENDVAAGVDG